MKITIESTDAIVELDHFGNKMPARIWEGTTESGIPVHCFITRIGVKDTEDCYEFERDLKEHRRASAEILAIPLRLII